MVVSDFVDELVYILESMRFTASNERDLQEDLSQFLCPEARGFAREYRLTARDRVDFFHPKAGVAIEVKCGKSGGSSVALMRQLARYAEEPKVSSIIVASPSLRIISPIPVLVLGKRVTKALLHTGL